MKIVIVGGGVSGCCAAINAKDLSNQVIILERGDKLLKKLLLTGNGRCNYFNDDQDLCHYHSRSSLIGEFVTSKNIESVRDFYDNLGIIPSIKNGYYYPYSNQASTLRDALTCEINRKRIEVYCNYLVTDIKKNSDGFIINDDIYCDKLIISTGSFAYPKTGSDGMGYDFLKKLGHTIRPVLPCLVQLESNMKYLKMLDGVRARAVVSLYEDDGFVKSEEGEVQFTNYGISGICIFNLSYYVSLGIYNKRREVVSVNFVPFINGDYNEWFNNYYKKLGNVTVFEMLSRMINKKIVEVILKICDISYDTKFSSLDDSVKERLYASLYDFRVEISGTRGFSDSQVCSGGVALEEINHSDFSSLIVPNLYILGELVDIVGDCGGYNLTMCFMSGILSGRSLR